jgi:hypothetical protein
MLATTDRCSGSGLTCQPGKPVKRLGILFVSRLSLFASTSASQIDPYRPSCSSQSRRLGISASPVNGLRVASLRLVRHRPSPACAVMNTFFAPAVRPTLTVARWGTAKALGCPRLGYSPVPRLFSESSSRLRAPAFPMDRTSAIHSGSVVISPSQVLHCRAVSFPGFPGSGLLSCDHGLSPGLSTNWENIEIVKERV